MSARESIDFHDYVKKRHQSAASSTDSENVWYHHSWNESENEPVTKLDKKKTKKSEEQAEKSDDKKYSLSSTSQHIKKFDGRYQNLNKW